MVPAVFPVRPRPTCAVIQNLSSESDGSLLRHLWDSSGFSLRRSLFALKVASRVMPLQLVCILNFYILSITPSNVETVPGDKSCRVIVPYAYDIYAPNHISVLLLGPNK